MNRPVSAGHRRALIVDDSRTAQVRLRKMLERYGLEIDVAASAEEALSYLSVRTPAVIFLDHLMPGLDGFEALRIIKSNPRTAMIPVVMYTSKSGEVYVGQARALGAIDVLSKDVIAPSNLENVLRVIGLLPKDAAPAQSTPPPAAAPRPPAEAAPPAAPGTGPEADHEALLELLRRQTAHLLEIHLAKLRQEVVMQSRSLYKRLARDLKALAEREPAPPPPPPPPPPAPRAGRGAQAVIVLLLLVLLVQQWRLFARLETPPVAPAPTAAAPVEPTPPVAAAPEGPSPFALLAALQWALNEDNLVPFGVTPLGEASLPRLQELVGRLDQAGFRGTVLLRVHRGDFCVVHDEGGQPRLPPPETPIEDCRRLGETTGAGGLQDVMSVAFVNFLVSAPPLVEGRLRIDVDHRGFSEPRLPYPEDARLAGEWNRIAAANNRIEVRFDPRLEE
ncbi:MAG: hypothetical protein KatS3mg121_0593 [Gammaproteobacteria bacterium]|nr:MAG: hypothetical protein KatS3mg121_0593 [Gammaproteobacteria bacterium]